MHLKLLVVFTSISILSGCDPIVDGNARSRHLAGQVGFEHFECSVINAQRAYTYKLVMRKDYGDREKTTLDLGGEILRHPILDAELIRPDGSRHEGVRYVSVQRNDGNLKH